MKCVKEILRKKTQPISSEKYINVQAIHYQNLCKIIHATLQFDPTKRLAVQKICESMNSFKDASISYHPISASQASALEEHDPVVIDHIEKNYSMEERR